MAQALVVKVTRLVVTAVSDEPRCLVTFEDDEATTVNVPLRGDLAKTLGERMVIYCSALLESKPGSNGEREFELSFQEEVPDPGW